MLVQLHSYDLTHHIDGNFSSFLSCAQKLYMYARQLFEEQFIQLGFDDDAVDDTSP